MMFPETAHLSGRVVHYDTIEEVATNLDDTHDLNRFN